MDYLQETHASFPHIPGNYNTSLYFKVWQNGHSLHSPLIYWCTSIHSLYNCSSKSQRLEMVQCKSLESIKFLSNILMVAILLPMFATNSRQSLDAFKWWCKSWLFSVNISTKSPSGTLCPFIIKLMANFILRPLTENLNAASISLG